MRRAALVALSAALAAGCATRADVNTLEQSLVEEMRAMRAEQDALRSHLRAAIDSLAAMQGRQTLTEQGEFQRQVDRLEDQIAELLHLVSQNHQLLNDLYANRGIAGAPGPAGGVPGAPPGRGDPDMPMVSGADDAETQFYNAALQQFRQGNYATARGAFEEFLATWPSDELAPDAQFYVAETYAAEGNDAQAIAEYRRVLELFPDSRRAPTSLYKRALIEKRLGNLAVARSLLTQIEAGYPSSPEAPLAREELRKISG
ncbi:MAG: tol-pal system protein YbgF [Gemmatimonadota bacterium]